MTVSRVPATPSQSGTLLEDYIHTLELGMLFGALLKPRTVLAVVRGTMETVAPRDNIFEEGDDG
eukprot:12825469-Prorocentrum_lima.AAC.1